MTNVDLLKAVIEDKQQTAAALSIADDLVRVDLSLADARALLAELESQSARLATDPVAAGVEWTAEQLKAGLAEIAAQRPKLDGDKVHEAMWGIILEERRKVAQLIKERDDWKEGSEMHLRMYDHKRQLANSLTAQLAAAQQRAEEADARWNEYTTWLAERIAPEPCGSGPMAGLAVAYNKAMDLAAPPAAEPPDRQREIDDFDKFVEPSDVPRPPMLKPIEAVQFAVTLACNEQYAAIGRLDDPAWKIIAALHDNITKKLRTLYDADTATGETP